LTQLYCGVDFGTTNSSVAVSDGVSARVLHLDDGNDPGTSLPSLLYITRDGESIVGRAAANAFIDRNVDREVILKQIEAPPSEWKSVLDVFQHTLAHEVKVTEKIHAIVKLATNECDYATLAFLQWFVSEQVEEEAQTTSIVEKLKLMGDGNIGLFILDGELGKRAAG